MRSLMVIAAVLAVGCKRSSDAPPRIEAKCAQPCDVTSAASIDYALTAIREPVQPPNGCIERRLDNRLVKLGTKTGATCAFDRVLANCCLFGPKDDRGILDALGWATMPPQLREQLVPGFIWAMYDRVGITDAPAGDAFGGAHVFTPPILDTLPDGSVEYIAWWSKVTGDAIAYTRTSWVITTDGGVEATDAETFTAPIK